MQESLENENIKQDDDVNKNINTKIKEEVVEDKTNCNLNDKLKRYYVKLISEVYSTNNGEVLLLFEYLYQANIYKHKNMYEISKKIENFIQVEISNINKLAKLMLNLNVSPVFSFFPPYKNWFFSTRFVDYNNDELKMIDLSIKRENNIILIYDKIIKLIRENNIIKVLDSILLEHKNNLKLLQEIKNTLQNK